MEYRLSDIYFDITSAIRVKRSNRYYKRLCNKTKKKIFKNVEVVPWECCYIPEMIFAAYKDWTSKYLHNLTLQYDYWCKQSNKEWYNKDNELAYLELYLIADYVHTREVNKAKWEYLNQLDDEVLKRNHRLYIDYWFDRDELMFKTKITEENWDKESLRLTFWIGQKIEELDREKAMQLVKYTYLIWD